MERESAGAKFEKDLRFVLWRLPVVYRELSGRLEGSGTDLLLSAIAAHDQLFRHMGNNGFPGLHDFWTHELGDLSVQASQVSNNE